MWGAAIIVFREVFEIAIVICVVLAATKELKHKAGWIWLGILGGAAGAGLVALLTQTLAQLSGAESRYYVNATILLAAVLMVGYTVVWMKQHSKTIVSNLKTLSNEVIAGTKPKHMLAIIIGMAVLREGAEIVLFLYGLMATGQMNWLDLFSGSVLGMFGGVIAGLLMYYGLIRMSVKYLFQTTSVLLTLIAAGMAANAAGKLVSAGVLPALIQSVWDTSSILPQKNLLGKFLFILVGYQENPNAMQVLFYLATVAVIILASKWQAKS